MRVRLKGINRVKKKLSDGSTAIYYYAWKGGPRLDGAPGQPEFIASYNAAVAARKTTPDGMLLAILQAYQTSTNFKDLGERTRKDYVRQIKRI